MPVIYRVTYRRQATGEVLWQREMTSTEFGTWLAQGQARVEADLAGEELDHRIEARKALSGETRRLLGDCS